MKDATPIAIVAALHDELARVLALMPDEHKQVVGGRAFWVGHLHGYNVVAVLSGIGKVAAATTATLLIQHFGVGRIVFTGVAGGLAAGVNVGDVVAMGQDLEVKVIAVEPNGRIRLSRKAVLLEEQGETIDLNDFAAPSRPRGDRPGGDRDRGGRR